MQPSGRVLRLGLVEAAQAPREHRLQRGAGSREASGLQLGRHRLSRGLDGAEETLAHGTPRSQQEPVGQAAAHRNVRGRQRRSERVRAGQVDAPRGQARGVRDVDPRALDVLARLRAELREEPGPRDVVDQRAVRGVRDVAASALQRREQAVRDQRAEAVVRAEPALERAVDRRLEALAERASARIGGNAQLLLQRVERAVPLPLAHLDLREALERGASRARAVSRSRDSRSARCGSEARPGA